MIDERLEHAIEKAARELIAREPSRALSYNVMVRVRRGEVSTPRGAWLKAAACVCAAGIVVAYLAINRPARENAPVATPQVVRTEHVPVPAPRIEVPEEARAESRTQARPRAAAGVTRAPRIRQPIGVGLVSIEPINVEPIGVPSIEVPRLEPLAPASIEAIKIEALTIEPLAASND